MPDDELEALLAQPKHVTDQREALQERLQKMEEALKLFEVQQLA
jgi:hypothetical protein